MLTDITAISHSPLVHTRAYICKMFLCKVWVEKQKACLSSCHQSLLELECENRVAVSLGCVLWLLLLHPLKQNTHTLAPSPSTSNDPLNVILDLKYHSDRELAVTIPIFFLLNKNVTLCCLSPWPPWVLMECCSFLSEKRNKIVDCWRLWRRKENTRAAYFKFFFTVHLNNNSYVFLHYAICLLSALCLFCSCHMRHPRFCER